MTIVTHSFGTGLIKSSEVNTNFNDLTSALDSITTTNLHESAGIVSSQLADKYGLSPWSISVVPFSRDTTLSTTGTNALYICGTADTEIIRTTTRVQSSKKASIAFIEVYCVEKVADTTDPKITIKLDDIILGGVGRVITTDHVSDASGFHYIYNSNPISNPLINFDNNQTLKVLIGGQGNSPKIRGVTVTLWIKEELAS